MEPLSQIIIGLIERFGSQAANVQTRQDHGRLNSAIDPAVDRFRTLDEEQQDDCRNACTVFARLYAFLSQIMPFSDVDLEKLYVYLRFFLTKLPKDGQGAALRLDDEVVLEYCRLQKIREGSVELKKGARHLLIHFPKPGSCAKKRFRLNCPRSSMPINSSSYRSKKKTAPIRGKQYILKRRNLVLTGK